MDVGKLRKGEWLAALSAVALLAFTFLPWFGRGALDRSAWQAFAVLDVVLVAFAGMGLGLAAVAGARRAPAAPVAAAVVTAAVGIVLSLVLLVRLVFPPGPNALVGVQYGALLGLVATIGITAGAWLAMGDERTDAVETVPVPAQPVPPAVAPAGSLVAEGQAPGADDDRD